MSEGMMAKQSVGGFKITSSSTKTTKEGEVIKITLSGLVEDISAGGNDMGKILKALLDHQTSQMEVGLSVLIGQHVNTP